MLKSRTVWLVMSLLAAIGLGLVVVYISAITLVMVLMEPLQTLLLAMAAG